MYATLRLMGTAMTDANENNPTWSAWIKTQIATPGKSIADLVKYGTTTGLFGRNAAYRWRDGENTPNKPNVVLGVAEFFGADPQEALAAAGLAATTGGADIVYVTDPAAPFIAKIRARGLPPIVEERLIEKVRRDLSGFDSALDDQLDIVEQAHRLAGPEPATG